MLDYKGISKRKRNNLKYIYHINYRYAASTIDKRCELGESAENGRHGAKEKMTRFLDNWPTSLRKQYFFKSLQILVPKVHYLV